MITIAFDGTRTSDILRLELALTDGVPCDSFSAELLPSFEAAARGAKRVCIYDGTRLVFTGIADEVETRLDGGGRRLLVSGRGLAALLMQTEWVAAHLNSAAAADILGRYVTPCGVTAGKVATLPPVSFFTVVSGSSCWRVLRDFAGWSAGIIPRFAPDGTLTLAPPEGASLEITTAHSVLAASVNRLRCSLASEAVVTERTSGKTLTHSDAELKAAGFNGKLSLIAPHGTLSAYRARAEWAVREPKRRWVTAEVTLAGGFAAMPCDRVRLRLGEGLEGDFRVSEAKTVTDTDGARTFLKLVRA